MQTLGRMAMKTSDTVMSHAVRSMSVWPTSPTGAKTTGSRRMMQWLSALHASLSGSRPHVQPKMSSEMEDCQAGSQMEKFASSNITP